MNISRVSLFIALSASLAFGQGSQLPKYTVATLPAASSQITYTVQVIDGTTNTDCVTGGASGHSAYNVICSVRWNGSAYVWAPVNTVSGGGMVYPGAGVANSTGSAWGTSYAVGTGANDLVQLNSSSQLPAVSGALLTNLPFMSLTTTGTSGPATLTSGVLNIPQYSGGSGSGVQYNPTTTAYIVSTWSGMYDDSDSNSANLGVPSSVSCLHTTTSTCTVAFASAHGLSVGGAIDMFNLSSWPYAQQAAQYGSFQVTTVPDSTHITFTTPTTLTYTCGPCTGNVYDASLWGIWQFAKQPYIYGHGTVYGLEQTSANLNTNWTSLTSGISGTPTYLIDATGINDFASGSSAATVLSLHQSIWAKAHTAGMTVVQTTLPPAQYGVSGVNVVPGQFNILVWEQGIGKTATTTANGQYIDRYVDIASALLKEGNISSMPNPTVNQVWAKLVNDSFGAQNGLPAPPPSNFSFSSSGLGNDLVSHYFGGTELFYDQTWTLWQQYLMNAGGSQGVDRYMGTFNATSLNREWFAGLGVGNTWTADTFGRDSGNNNGFYRSFHYAGANSTSNYEGVGPFGGTDVIRFLGTGEVQLPNVATAASTAPACFNGTNGGLTNVGCTSASSAFSGITSGTNTTAAMVVGSGASLAPTGTGTIQATNISGTVTAGTGASVTGSGTTASPYVVAVTGSGPASAVSITVANAGTTGTTLNTLTKLTGAPSTAVIAATTDTGGVIGITTAGAGTTASATIQLNGLVNCVFPGATTAGDYVQISSGIAGNCADSGATYPTSGQVIGRVLSTNAAGGTYQINLFPAEIKAASSAASVVANLCSTVTLTNATCTNNHIVVTGGSTSVTVSALPSSGYNNLKVVYKAFQGTSNNDVSIYFNGDTNNANYGYALAGSASSSATNDTRICASPASGTDPASCVFEIADFLGTTTWKTADSFGGQWNGTSIQQLSYHVEWKSNAAITSFQLTPKGGSFATGTVFSLYAEQ